jgi:hypothetical protein
MGEYFVEERGVDERTALKLSMHSGMLNKQRRRMAIGFKIETERYNTFTAILLGVRDDCVHAN